MRALQLSLAIGLALSGSGHAQDLGGPMSAIDWLSQSVETPVALPPQGSQATPAPGIDPGPAVSSGALSPDVTVSSLDQLSPDVIGLLPPRVTGLPKTLWSASSEETLVMLLQAERVETLPAVQDLLTTLLLAEADAPFGAGPDGKLFLARVDKLLDMGALEPAQALLEAAKPETPDLFRRWFDVALLTATEQDACKLMQSKPGVAPTHAARIFCLARAGDWNSAALILNTGRALGDIDDETDILLSRFLDPDLYEGDPPLPPPTRVSPLEFRLREAIGERMSTASLPRAFSQSDLADTASWRDRIEAGERLSRTGAISENHLQNLYTANRPSASGGVWDRAARFQAFDAALASGISADIAATLPDVWAEMTHARLEVPFARLYGAQLAETVLPEDIAETAFQIALLSPAYEIAAIRYSGRDSQSLFLQAVARGDLTGVSGTGQYQTAIAAAFDSQTPMPVPAELATLAADGKLGEALLRATAALTEGLTADPQSVAEAIVFFRSVGLEDVARRTALQYLLLDRAA